jgi:predicted neuraminidase
MLRNLAAKIRLAAGTCFAGSRPRTKVTPSRQAASSWIIFAMAALLVASPSHAHHSGVMFDQGKQITLSGTVKQFQWTNPHCWIQLIAESADSRTEWSVQMGAPTELFRGGWRPGTLKAGDRIRVVIHPAREDVKAGMFVSATRSSGEPLGRQTN